MFLRNIHTLSASLRHNPWRGRRFSTIDVDRDRISVSALNATFPFVWLRDSCQCPLCVHPSTRQKLHRSSDFAQGITPAEALAVDGGLRVSWAPPGSDTKHVSFYPTSFLERHASSASLAKFHRDINPEPWTAAKFASHTTIPYSELENPQVLLELLRQLRRDGLVFLTDVPSDETSDADCELRKLANRISVIRKTFYGETWDVRNVRNSKNIAYTNLDLGLHMDLLYFKEPPRYQILHSLRNCVRGGQSLFVDALYAAQRLQASSPVAFTELVNTPVPFHYVNDGHHLHHSHPTIQLSPLFLSSSQTRSDINYAGAMMEITSINYSPPFQAPLPVNTLPSFYKSLADFTRFLEDPDACVTRLLREGDAVVFDNRRVLHGRASFEDIVQDSSKGAREGETSRWLKGCYLEEDPVLDRMCILSSELDK
ncbi:Clavaminate synthase-like protein [Fomitiporia mediterranea MF3/22]|uniref:Clavaminate synthase-like protein n=1 Tax=Fomitiporia mediterranea (strain MF3/22) TaxID=694068 RepID=UPI00044096F8|nr:Clavaminate synthase-like protein [Fomitiporia mediterranea MF3/22]EJD06196.1 Clavaminate synthase-like protein [Fomitiporia mediterranea MF3/22]